MKTANWKFYKINGFLSHQLLKMLKYAILVQKPPFHARKSATIPQNRHLTGSTIVKFPISGFQNHRL